MDRYSSRTIYLPHIVREEYPRFHAGLPKDSRLPPRYEDWYSGTIRVHAVYRGEGVDTEPVPVRWDDFVAHAERNNLIPTYALLTTYVTSHGREVHRGDQSGNDGATQDRMGR